MDAGMLMKQIQILVLISLLCSCISLNKQDTDKAVQITEAPEHNVALNSNLYDDLSMFNKATPTPRPELALATPTPTPTPAPKALAQGEFGVFDVKKEVTLPYIAYKIYGNLKYFKELAALNPQYVETNKIPPNAQIKFIRHDNLQKPPGKKYVVKKNDTLQKISMKLYGTSRKWQMLWENNKSLYQTPDDIYPGCPIYYLPI